MSFHPGDVLGSFEIVGAIGAGGMGEVYRARDTKLNRDVAIKVLPELFASNPDRLTRFTREAQTLAALNHPNIAAIYGIEGSSLVMELVDGEDLSQIIRRGPMAIADVLPIARQIAEALEAAHEQGIVHRDLKPANIKVRTDGTVKVLDFGLAKAMDPAASSSPDAMLSPTFTTPVGMTQLGVILGTAAYMAPEQAKGRAVDKRADIWAFGVVLYEMLTGTALFHAEDISETLAAVLTRDVNLSAMPERVPAHLRALVRDCLVRDPKRRLRDIGDARLALDGAAGIATEPRGETRRPLVWIFAAIAAASLALAAFAWWDQPAVTAKRAIRFTIALPPGQEITSYPAITRDGRTIAYVTQHGNEEPRLYLRDLDAFESRAVAGSDGAKQPFFSPDGKWIAFFARGQLLKAEVAGGAPVRLTEAAYPFGGTWADDDTIVFAASLGSGLLRLPSRGGTAASLTKPDGGSQGYAHVFPQALPGGRSLLFTIWGHDAGSAVLSLDTGQWTMVLPSAAFSAATFQPTGGSRGRLLVVDQGAAGIRAASFDVAHPAVTSADTSVLDNVFSEIETESMGWLAVSATGTAVYATGNPSNTSLVWIDRDGKISPLDADRDQYREVSLSPDGQKAVIRHGVGLWIHDLQRGTKTPLTSGPGSNIMPLWSHDGRRILFASNRGGDWDIYAQAIDGSQPAEAILKRPRDQFPLAERPDGTLLYTEIDPRTGRDLWSLSPDGASAPVRVTPFNETAGQFSPGAPPAAKPGAAWLAYSSDESGRNEIYVQSYPDGTARVPVSTQGGILPTWSPDGKELFYVTGDAMAAVTRQPDGTFGAPRRLFDRSTFLFNHRFHSYGVSPDGRRFLMIQRDPASVPRQLNVIVNW